jgi:4-diphosphocytidyl-2-C-methyl-D-erythritol kinase
MSPERATLVERAPAKVNLTLTVHGRRPDGFHELESLVAFARIGDTLALEPGTSYSLQVTGPFARAIDRENLITAAIGRATAQRADLITGRFTLNKQLPVAAGIGGGSADAAAALRLIRRANPEAASAIDWCGLAAQLGADVPVCLLSETTIMRGFGECLIQSPPVPQLHAVLVNAGAAVVPAKTARVFQALGAGPVSQPVASVLLPPWPTDQSGWYARIARVGNDLERTASAVMPEIIAVKRALAAQPGVQVVQLSGAGPTCFGLYADADQAQAAHIAIATQHPDWWVTATTLG